MKYRIVKNTNKGNQIGINSYTYEEALSAQERLAKVGIESSIVEEIKALTGEN